MRRWFSLSVLVLVVAVSAVGCKAMSRPPRERSQEPGAGPRVPNGEASPFDW
jgi:hypothetical protein